MGRSSQIQGGMDTTNVFQVSKLQRKFLFSSAFPSRYTAIHGAAYVRCFMDDTGLSFGYGFILFHIASESSAEHKCHQFQNYEIKLQYFRNSGVCYASVCLTNTHSIIHSTVLLAITPA